MHASGATAGVVVVLATCIVLKGYEKGLLCWGLHVISLPNFEFVLRNNNCSKLTFGVGSLCFFAFAL